MRREECVIRGGWKRVGELLQSVHERTYTHTPFISAFQKQSHTDRKKRQTSIHMEKEKKEGGREKLAIYTRV